MDNLSWHEEYTDWDQMAIIAERAMKVTNFTIDDVRDDLKEYRQCNPLTNAKNMLRKSMLENGRTAEDVRRDLKEV